MTKPASPNDDLARSRLQLEQEWRTEFQQQANGYAKSGMSEEQYIERRRQQLGVFFTAGRDVTHPGPTGPEPSE